MLTNDGIVSAVGELSALSGSVPVSELCLIIEDTGANLVAVSFLFSVQIQIEYYFP